MNCKADVQQGAGKFFAEVFVCESCQTLAQHFHERLERELKHLLVMAKESIRVALVQGKFIFPEAPVGEPSKREVLESILQMNERRERTTKEQAWPTASTESTSAPAVGQAAVALASFNKDSPQG